MKAKSEKKEITKEKVVVAVKRKMMQETVVSVKRTNTVGVSVTRFVEHPMYKKSVKRTRVFAAQNTMEGIAVGDHVKIEAVRPISKTKHFIVTEKIGK